jgi:hypothetical protein
MMPRKREEIKGVSGSSFLSLQAQLYKTKEDAAQRSSGLDASERRVRGAIGLDLRGAGSKRNAGVEERARRDALQLKARSSEQCSPRHPTHFEPSLQELYDTL